MAKAAQVLPMDLDQDARSLLQQQQEGHNKELDRKDSVRARLLAISRVEPVVSGSPLCSMMPLSPVKVKRSPESTHQGGSEDEFRRKLISISYADVILPDQ
nr:hypothetical protein PHYPA_012241 [Physcomitrium patens]